MKSNDVINKSGLTRGTKSIVSTGHDGSSYGGTGTKDLKGKEMKGGVNDLSSSIAGASARTIR